MLGKTYWDVPKSVPAALGLAIRIRVSLVPAAAVRLTTTRRSLWRAVASILIMLTIVPTVMPQQWLVQPTMLLEKNVADKILSPQRILGPWSQIQGAMMSV
jgi:hypothetical protein